MNGSLTIVKNYITQDFNREERESYECYINGDENSTLWINKCLKRRDSLLILKLKCDIPLCNGWVHIRETGNCHCSFFHNCNYKVIQAIKNLN